MSILCSWFALLFFSSPLPRRCIRIPFSFRNPISGRCPVFPWISTAPNLLISRLLLSHPSFPPPSSLPLSPRPANPRYRSFHANMPSLFFQSSRSNGVRSAKTKRDERVEKIKEMTAIKRLIRSPCSGNTHLERVVQNEYRDCQFRRFHAVPRRST